VGEKVFRRDFEKSGNEVVEDIIDRFSPGIGNGKTQGRYDC